MKIELHYVFDVGEDAHDFYYDCYPTDDDYFGFLMPLGRHIEDENLRKAYLAGARQAMKNVFEYNSQMYDILEDDTDFISYLEDKYYKEARKEFNEQ